MQPAYRTAQRGSLTRRPAISTQNGERQMPIDTLDVGWLPCRQDAALRDDAAADTANDNDESTIPNYL